MLIISVFIFFEASTVDSQKFRLLWLLSGRTIRNKLVQILQSCRIFIDYYGLVEFL